MAASSVTHSVRSLLDRCKAMLNFNPPARRKSLRGRITAFTEVPENRCLMSATSTPAPLYGSVTFDFGTDQSPVELGAIQVSSTIRYSPQRGYGMTSSVSDVDRGRDDDLNRDFVEGRTVSFRVDVPNGIYQVEPGIGDRLRLRDRVQISLNGEVRDLVTTLGGTPAFPSYTVVVTDGSIRFEAQDNGGDSETAAITSLTITALDEAAGIPDDVQAGPVATSPLIIVETHGRVSPPKKNGGLLGTIVSRAAGEAVSKQIGGEEGEFIGGIVEDAVKSAFPSEGRPPVPDWVYELPRAVARSVRREGLGTLNPNVRPIPLPKIEKASGDAELLALQRGSRDFIAVNWSIESSFGTPQEIGEVLDDTSDIYSERQHRASVTRAALATFRMLEARIRQELQKNPQAKVDLLIVGHSFGTSVNRDVVRMLNTSGLAEHLDFVKVVELDPVAMKADANPAERADSHDRYFWSHPEIARNGRPIVDSVVNYYQTEGLAFTGVIEKGLILGKPLDGMDGGGMLGFRNGHAMVFSPLSGETLDQFRLTSGKSGRPSDGDLRNGVFSDDGRLLAVASEDGTVSIRDAVSHREIRRMVISKRAVTDVQFMPGSAEIVTVSKDGLIRVLRVADGVEVWNGLHKGKPVVKPDGDKVYKGAKTVAIRGDGRLLATAGSAGKIRIWLRTPGARTGFEPAQTLDSHAGGTTSVTFAPDGTLVTAGNDGFVRIWKQGRDVYRLAQTIELTDKVRKVAFSPDGRQLAVAAGQSVSLWMFSANGVLLRTREFRDHVSDAHALAFNADGSRLATGGSDRTIFIYDVASGTRVNVLNQAMLEVRNLAFSPDGRQLLATYFDLQGGPVNDINVTRQVRSRVGLIENIRAGGSAHHSEVPYAYIDLVIRPTNDGFFEMRDKPRASRYGDFLATDLTLPDSDTLPSDADPGESDSVSDDSLTDPWLDQIDNFYAPEFVNTVPNFNVTDAMSISISQLAVDPDGKSLTWTVRSADTEVMLATIEGTSLRLRPLKEGPSEIELTANDGRWAAQIRFTVTADGSAWRQKAARLRSEAEAAFTRLRIISTQIEQLEKSGGRLNAQWKDLDEQISRLRNSVAELQKDVAAASSRVERLRTTRTSLTAARNAADSALARAEAALQSAQNQYSAIDSRTRQLFQVYDQRQNERQQARQRLDNATKSNRAARQADFNRASDAAAAAEASWRASRADRDAAERVVDQNRQQRNNMAAELARQTRLLAEADADLNRAQTDLATQSARLANRLAERTELTAQLNTLSTRLNSQLSELHSLRTEHSSLVADLKSQRERMVLYKQTKWVARIGLDKLNRNVLTPADELARDVNASLTAVITRARNTRERIDASSSQLKGLG